MLILASASPRRRELLTQVQVAHSVHPSYIDETRLPLEPAMDYVRRLALTKAHAVGALHPGSCVLAADTTVALGASLLNKPCDAQEASSMLRSLAGRTHHVHTGIAVLYDGEVQTHVETTAVTFSPIPEDELAVYLHSGDSLDKAGAYGIQGYAARWVTRIDGDFFNVVGLPLAATMKLLRSVPACLSSAPHQS